MNKSYHFLVCAEVTFINENSEQHAAGVARVNCVVQSDTELFGVKQIAQAQQLAQAVLDRKLKEEVTAIDVVLISVNNLGNMTDEEFNNYTPEKTDTGNMTETVIQNPYSDAGVLN